MSLAHFTNMKIIAEGIETEKELLKLINLGVSTGQGYLLQRPYKKFLDISEDIKKKIIKYNNIRQNQLKSEISYIGNIVQKNPTFSLTASNKQVKKFFEFSSVTGVCIVKDNYPAGLIMQHNLDYILATQYGNSVFLKRPASLIMDSSPLIFDYYNTISNVSKIAMSRDSKRIYDYVIVTKENKYCGIVTIKNLLEYTVKFEKIMQKILIL
ncbi:CBS domain-containing protein [Clostridium tyrobutyricum]|uniref:CBS domain-containing protein n=1 Tax=Clostridium tyrobutyricum TaxID=1519 RepID=UPI001C3C862D